MFRPRYHQGSHCMTCTVSHCQDIGIYKYSCMPWVFPATKCSLPSKSWSPQKRSKRLTLPSTAPSTYHSWLPGAHPVFNLPVLMGSQASHVKVQHLTGMSLWTSAHIRFLRPSGRGSEPLLHHHSWRQWMLMFLGISPPFRHPAIPTLASNCRSGGTLILSSKYHHSDTGRVPPFRHGTSH